MNTTRPIRRLLIANRGEIAVRVSRTCREMGITSVAIFAKGDGAAPHVRACSEAKELRSEGVASYLDIEEMISAARQMKCDAVHPGYGFLAENPEFAQACESADLMFIGPSASAIRRLGDKAAAKELARKLSIPTIEGIAEREPEEAAFSKSVQKMGFPLLLKPLAGGGGKGMVTVSESAQWETAVSRARREAEAAFGDRRLLAERLIQRPRHVEVQIAADSFGNVQHVFERDCTLQRRHQKVVEESPSPFLSPGVRTRLFEAAEQLVREAGYRNVGTVEFLLDENGKYYFMEMNTRLQVEHPVTECVADVDLVRTQFLIAQGYPLSEAVGTVRSKGHAIESRVYAEDPGAGFLPASGKVRKLVYPDEDRIRIDSGIEEGILIGADYDPLLFKIISFGKNRREAMDRMHRTVSGTIVLGISHNLNFLRWVMEQKVFADAQHDTEWISRSISEFQEWEQNGDLAAVAAIAQVAEHREKERARQNPEEDSWTTDPWRTLGAWRLGS